MWSIIRLSRYFFAKQYFLIFAVVYETWFFFNTIFQQRDTFYKNPNILHLYFIELEKATLFRLGKNIKRWENWQKARTISSLLLFARIARIWESTKHPFVRATMRHIVAPWPYIIAPIRCTTAFISRRVFSSRLIYTFLRLRFLFALKEKKTIKSHSTRERFLFEMFSSRVAETFGSKIQPIFSFITTK